MLEAQTLEPVVEKGLNGKVGVIVGEFNSKLTESLLKACKKTLEENGLEVGESDIYRVPGAFEIPWMAQRLSVHHEYDVLITLGVVLKGDTYHFDMIANECTRGVMDVMLKYNVPIVFEVLACYTKEDAAKRCGNDEYNKGIEAAKAAIKMLEKVRGVKV